MSEFYTVLMAMKEYEKELEYNLNDYETRDLGDVSQILLDNEDGMEEILKQAT